MRSVRRMLSEGKTRWTPDLDIRATRCFKVRPGKRRMGRTRKSMKITRVFKSTMVAAVIAGALLMAPSAANARVFIAVGIAPPAIPFYEQPLSPGYGYIWTPGYWAYGDDGYYWVDGAWVYPPYVDALWTPGYWGWGDGGYCWYPGYWGRTIGYYGGYWNGGHFFYNRAYNHIGFRDHDHDRFVYDRRVNGFDGRPGGSSFARNDRGGDFNRGGDRNRGGDFNRGSGVNGNTFANRGGNSFAGNRGGQPAASNLRSGFMPNGGRPEYNGGAARSFNSGNTSPQYRQNYAAPQARSFNAAPAYRSYDPGGGQVQSRGNFSAPAAAPQRSEE